MLTRRCAIASAVGVSAAVVLTACTPEVTELGSSPAPTQTPTSESQPPVEVCKTSDIPVGSGKQFNVSGKPVLITQPKPGEFRAFSAECTHAGYVINNVSGDEIKCDNHGAVFNSDTGSVLKGPAARALGKIALEVQGDTILVSF